MLASAKAHPSGVGPLRDQSEIGPSATYRACSGSLSPAVAVLVRSAPTPNKKSLTKEWFWSEPTSVNQRRKVAYCRRGSEYSPAFRPKCPVVPKRDWRTPGVYRPGVSLDRAAVSFRADAASAPRLDALSIAAAIFS